MEAIQLEKVVILLDDNKSSYMGGDTISGTVNIKLNGKLKMSILSIILRATSEVRWTEYPSAGHLRAGFVFTQNQNHLDMKYEIPDNIRESVIQKGSHIIPFVFKLPVDIPSSVDTDYGHIKYWIEMTIKDDAIAVDFAVDYKDKKYFNVESPFRRNLHLSVGAATEKDMSFLCAESGKIHMDANIRKKGHIPGETVDVHCVVSNQSHVVVTPRITFLQTQIFMAKERHKTVEVTTEPVIGEPVMAGETREQNITIEIPKQTSLSVKSKHITLKYFIRVSLEIPNAIDMELNLPLVITNQNALNDCFDSYNFIE